MKKLNRDHKERIEIKKEILKLVARSIQAEQSLIDLREYYKYNHKLNHPKVDVFKKMKPIMDKLYTLEDKSTRLFKKLND